MARALALCLCLAGAAAPAVRGETWGEWAETARKQHPLAGSFYWPRGGPLWQQAHGEGIAYEGKVQRDDDGEGRLFRFVSPDARGVILPAPANIFLLGEVHDNPMHHRVRAWLIESRPVPSSLGAAVFEQIRADQQPALDKFKGLADAGGGADALFELLEWDKSGWPAAAIYKPLMQAVIAAQLPIFAGDLPRDQVRAVARGGMASVPAEERARLGLDAALPPPLAEALDQELAESHCGALPPQAIPGMAAAQRYRDAYLADAVVRAADQHGYAVLIAGNGHVRSDRGVPWYIRQRKPDARVMSIVLAEVEAGKNDPAAYVPRDPEGKPAADMVIFTPRAERGDPCQSLGKKAR